VDALWARSRSDVLLSAKAPLTSVVYPRRATLVVEDFFGALRDGVVVGLRFGCRGGSVDDVSASEAFSAVANAASPLIKSVQASQRVRLAVNAQLPPEGTVKLGRQFFPSPVSMDWTNGESSDHLIGAQQDRLRDR
jgi:hypothetical protein